LTLPIGYHVIKSPKLQHHAKKKLLPAAMKTASYQS